MLNDITVTVDADTGTGYRVTISSAQAGAAISVSDIVQISGSGWARTPTFSVGLYLSSDATITSDDILLGSRSVPSGLLPPTGHMGTTSVTIPASTPAGVYYLGAIADYANVVVESNSNNGLAGHPIQVAAARPDLVVSSVTGPNSARRGDSVSGNVTVQNPGTAATGAGFSVAIYLSTDNVIASSDTQLATVNAAALDPGASQTFPWGGQIPTTIPKGTYYIGAIADSTNVISEGNENNNGQAGSAISVR